MTSDEADEFLEYLMEQGYLTTRINSKTKQQELAITEFGEDVYKVLKGFVEGMENYEINPMLTFNTNKKFN